VLFYISDKPMEIEQNIAKIDRKMQELCDMWPHNKDCFMLEAAHRHRGPVTDSTEMLTKKFLRALLEKDEKDRKFVASFTGSSNTAGHGSYGKHAYPHQLNDLLKDIYADFGVTFSSRNQALGSMSAMPHSGLCHRTLFGMDPDLINYEFGMFGEGDCPIELWARLGSQLPRQPALLLLSPNGPSHCARWWTKIYYNRRDNAQDVTSHVGQGAGYTFKHPEKPMSFYLSDEYINANENGTSDLLWLEKYYTPTDEELKAIMTGTEPNPKKYDFQEKLYGDLGFYYPETSASTRYDYKPFYLYRAGLCRAAHHPASIGHLIIASQISYLLLQKTKDAFQLIKENSSAKGLNELYDKSTKRVPLPSRENLYKKGCSLEGAEVPPLCFHTYEPHNDKSLYDLVTDYGNPTKPWVRKTVFGTSSKEKMAAEGYTDWHDAIVGTKDSGVLIFNFFIDDKIVKNHKNDMAYLMMCNGIFRFGKSTISVDEVQNQLEVKVNGIPVTISDKESSNISKFIGFKFDTDAKPDKGDYAHKLYSGSGYCFILGGLYPTADYTISVKVIGDKTMWITHLMAL